MARRGLFVSQMIELDGLDIQTRRVECESHDMTHRRRWHVRSRSGPERLE